MEKKQYFEHEPRPEVEQLARLLDAKIDSARETQMREHQTRMNSGSENQGIYPQYYERNNVHGYQDLSYERIMLKAPDHVRTMPAEFLSTPNNEEPWRGATFHIVRPYTIAEGYEDDTNEFVMPELPPELLDDDYFDDAIEDYSEYDSKYSDEPETRMRMYNTGSYVIYIEMPKDDADSCFIIHQNDGEYVIEPFDLELMGSIDDDIDVAVENLFDELASDIEGEPPEGLPEGESAMSENDQLVELEIQRMNQNIQNVAFAGTLLKHLRDKTTVTPFRHAA